SVSWTPALSDAGPALADLSAFDLAQVLKDLPINHVEVSRTNLNENVKKELNLLFETPVQRITLLPLRDPKGLVGAIIVNGGVEDTPGLLLGARPLSAALRARQAADVLRLEI